MKVCSEPDTTLNVSSTIFVILQLDALKLTNYFLVVNVAPHLGDIVDGLDFMTENY